MRGSYRSAAPAPPRPSAPIPCRYMAIRISSARAPVHQARRSGQPGGDDEQAAPCQRGSGYHMTTVSPAAAVG